MIRSSARLQKKGEEALKKEKEASKKKTSTKSASSKPKASAATSNPRKKPKVADGASKNVASSSKPNPAWSKVKGKRGQLKMVVEMPFDILLEIFKYLQPGDLLSLAMANKALRTLLLDRTVALPLWKSVRLGVFLSYTRRGSL